MQQDSVEHLGEPAPPESEERVTETDLSGKPCTEEAAQLKDRWLRCAAELENLKKRTAAEIERERRRERETILLEVLSVVDSLDSALGTEADDGNPWKEGMQAIQTQLLCVLARFQVRPFESRGQDFNPQQHEAVGRVERADVPAGVVAEVLQAGFVIDGERVLRPAKVLVAS